MGAFIPIIEQEGPVVEEELVAAGEVIGTEAEALGQKIEAGAEATAEKAEELAEEAEAKGKEILDEIGDSLSEQEVGQAESQCGTGAGPCDADIEEALASSNPGTKLEGQVAQGLKDAGFEVESFQREVGPGGSVGEVDVETPNAIIETTLSPSGKLGQIDKLINNPEMNPTGKPVILYAPNYGGAATDAVVGAGASVAKNMDQLTALLSQLGGK
jgi:hypothetical protein